VLSACTFSAVCRQTQLLIGIVVKQAMTQDSIVHYVSKVPTFKLSITFQILTDFRNFCTAGKDMKFATKPIRQYPPHLRNVATLLWEIENANFLHIFNI